MGNERMFDRPVIVGLLWLAVIAGAMLPAASRADPHPAPPPLATCRAVREYEIQEGRPRPQVDLEAVVIDVDPGNRSLFIRDETGATFAIPWGLGGTFESSWSRGDRVRLHGIPRAGRVFGGVRARSVTPLGRAPTEPRPITAEELAAGAAHHDLVSLACVGRAIAAGEETSASLIVNVAGRLGDSAVTIEFESPVPAEDLRRFIDADLRVVGRGSGDANDRRELIRTFLRVRSPADIEVVAAASADPFDRPVTAFTDIAPKRPAGDRPGPRGHRVKVAGVAAAAGVAGGIFLCAPGGGPEKEDVGLFIRPAAAAAAVAIAPGDLVEAVGFPTSGPFSGFLDAAEVRVTGRGEPPPLHEITPSSEWQANWSSLLCDNERVRVVVEVVSRVDRADETEIEAQCPLPDGISEPITFRIVAPPDLPSGIHSGARLEVRGLAQVTADRPHPQEKWLTLPTRFDLFVTAAEDIAFTPAPWWTRRGVVVALGWALAATAAAAVGAVALAVALRQTVRRQVALLEKKMQDEVVVEERRRIAREFHDSLEQDLAGLALRLDAAAGSVADDDTRGVLERQRALVARLQAETRQFVWDLRDPGRAHWSFGELLAAQVEDQQAVVGVPIHLEFRGDPAQVPLATRHHLLRIVREAVANAARHAAPSAIDVVVTGGPGECTTVEIGDDGMGFDLAACERKRGHFGIRGMRERARRIGAALAIDSRLRVGTRLVVTLGAGAGSPADGRAAAGQPPAAGVAGDIGRSDSGRTAAARG